MELSQREVDAFNADGYVGPFTLFEPDVAERLDRRMREEVLPVRSEVYAHTEADAVVAAYKPERMRDRHLDSPLAYRIAAAPEIVSRLRALLGPDILLWRSDGFEQRAGSAPSGTHQDGAFEYTTDPSREPVPKIELGDGETPVGHQTFPIELDIALTVSAWIALTRVRKETGALWVVPGTHKEHIPESKPAPGAFANQFSLSRDFEPSDGRAIEIEAGQFILFHNLLVHASYPVQHGRRFAWTTRYVSTATKIHHRATVTSQGQDLSRWGALLVAGRDQRRVNVLRAPPLTTAAPIVDELALDPSLHSPRSA
jgi:non-heme Fe2+,alpha-ketoglutarate-dependent halogenase